MGLVPVNVYIGILASFFVQQLFYIGNGFKDIILVDGLGQLELDIISDSGLGICKVGIT